MATWAERRKAAYMSIFATIIVAIGVAGYFIYFNNPPTCTDGKQNGEERGVDCGGVCVKLCTADNLEPIVAWARPFEIAPGVFNIFALVENPNLNSKIIDASYVMRAYDARNTLIATRNGKTFLPAGSTFGVLEAGFSFEEAPRRITLDFVKPLEYRRDSIQTQLRATDIRLTNDTPPRVDAYIENTALTPVGKVRVEAVVYGENGNAVAVSQTTIDGLAPEKGVPVTFTWPEPFGELAQRCETPTQSVLVLDRSGSMDDLGGNPPQPITDVLRAAQEYTDAVGERGRVGIVSFAGEATNPVDAPLGVDLRAVRDVISKISIGTEGIQHTNIAAGLQAALMQMVNARETGLTGDMMSEPGGADMKRLVVLLTDGVATRPLNPANANDQKYPLNAALEAAQALKSEGVSVYVIGLGNNLDEPFLRQIASKSDQYYRAPDASRVAEIYTSIGSTICKTSPKIDIHVRAE